jgi:hypothetical protein
MFIPFSTLDECGGKIKLLVVDKLKTKAEERRKAATKQAEVNQR